MRKLLKSRTNQLLILILVISSFLRLWQLGTIPPGIHSDEADTGYSAYSILKTGLSQYGTFNPLAIEEGSGGSHPPIYTYILIPLIHFFGLNIFIERLPSAIFGIATVYVIFLLARQLSSSARTGLIAAFLVAVNPWAIHISRQGLLESISLFFICWGVLLFLLGEKNRINYIFSAIIFGFSIFTYDAPKIFLPLFLIGLAWYAWRNLWKIKKIILVSIGIFLFFYLANLKVIFMDGQLKDYQWVSAFNKSEIEQLVDKERTETNAPIWLSSLFHNKLTVTAGKFLHSYSTVFSLNWMFLNGQGNLQESTSRSGEFYLFMLPFVIIGFYYLFSKKRKVAWLLLAWVLLGAIPGGITSGNYAYRSVLLLPVPIIASAYGVSSLLQYLEKRYQKRLSIFFKIIFGSIVCISVFSYLVTYFLDYPVYASDWWQKQRNDAIEYGESKKMKYDYVFIDGRFENNYAFKYLIDPKDFQKAFRGNLKYKEIKVIKFENLYFGNFSQSLNSQNESEFFPKKSLFIQSGSGMKNAKAVKTFYKPDGVEVLYRAIEIE